MVDLCIYYEMFPADGSKGPVLIKPTYCCEFSHRWKYLEGAFFSTLHKRGHMTGRVLLAGRQASLCELSLVPAFSSLRCLLHGGCCDL